MCFAINGNILRPEAVGIRGLMEAYNDHFPRLEPHGPPAHADIIRFAADYTS